MNRLCLRIGENRNKPAPVGAQSDKGWVAGGSTVNHLKSYHRTANGLEQCACSGGADDQVRRAGVHPARLRTEDGLTQNTVTSIVQTRDGYIWVGTFGGLARFDGVRFTLFTSSNTPELKSNRVVNLPEDRTGELWILSEQGTLARYANGRFSDYTNREGMPAGDIYCVLSDSQGDLWVGTHDQGMFQFHAGRLINHYTTGNGLPADFINTITEDHAGNLWAGTHGGLVKISRGQITTYTTQNGLPYNNVTNLVENQNGGLWGICLGDVTFGSKVVAESRVLRYRDGAFTLVEGSFGLISTMLHSFYEDRDGTLWIAGYDSGLQQWKAGRLSSFTVKDGLENEYVRTVMRDREGNLWFSPQGGGLVRWREKKLLTYTTKDGLVRDDVTSIIEDKMGNIWVGNFFLSRFSQGKFVTSPEFALTLQHGFVRALYVDNDDSLWFNHSLEIRAEIIRSKNGQRTNWPGIGLVNAIYRDRAGQMWIGWQEGLSQLVDGRFINYGVKEGLVAGSVVFIHEDRQGALWLGSTGGLSRFKDGKFTNYTTDQGLSHNFVRAVHEEQDGTFWLGTYGGGLNRFRDGRFVHITAANGLAEDIVSRILTDDDGNFWLSGNRGIYRIRRQELNDFADGKIRSVNPVSYGVADGMITSETNGGAQPAGWRARDGRFTSLHGANRTIQQTNGRRRKDCFPAMA